MSITYTYKIISVDQAARCMEVVYTAEGKPTMHIGARLPYEGESLEAIVRMYAPVRYWEELTLAMQPVEVGAEGSISISGSDAHQIAYERRNFLLAISDWTQLPDVPLTAEKKSEWATYRQQLRDVPEQAGFPNGIVWPAAPDAAADGTIPSTSL